MFNKKSFLFGFGFFGIYTALQDHRQWQKGFQKLKQVQRGIKGLE